MAVISKRLSSVFTIAIGIAYAGCGGLQQASAPLPGSAMSHRVSRPLPHSAKRQPLLYWSEYTAGGPYGSVYIYPLTGPSKERIGSITKGLKHPYGLSVDANNSLYVANVADCGGRPCRHGTVTAYPYGSKSPSMTYSKGPQHPLYPLADSAGHVFVSGYSVFGQRLRGFVFEYNAGTNVPIAHAQLGAIDDGIAEDASGNLYVAFSVAGPLRWNASIAEFGPGLTNKRRLGMRIHAPQGLLVDRAGNILVVESGPVDDAVDVFPPGATKPSVRIDFSDAKGYKPGQLAMQNNETTLWVSSERSTYGAYVYSMPYPLTSSTKPAQYEFRNGAGYGIAVSPR